MRSDIRKLLREYIDGARTHMEIAAWFASQPQPALQTLDIDDVLTELEDMVQTGELVEVEYKLANMPYRTKSVYFPPHTNIRVRGSYTMGFCG